MHKKFENENVLVERYWQVMAETIGINERNKKDVEYGIFPYGRQGELAGRVLRQWFGVEPKYIIDKKWSKFNPKIISLEQLVEWDNENMVIFIASDREDIYDEIRKNISECIKKGKVVDLFPVVNEDNNRKVETVRLLAKHFNSMQIKGAVAEAGVRDGAFAKYINKFFPSKSLYLFDTFEGFKNETVKNNMIQEEEVFEVNMDYIGFHHEACGMVPMPNPE